MKPAASLTKKPNAKQKSPPAPDKLPPHSSEAEAGVLGCVLLQPKSIADVLKALPDPAAFYELRHRILFEVIVVMHKEGAPVDMLTVQTRLTDAGKLEECGGIDYVSALPDRVPSAANLNYYLQILLEKFGRRQAVAFHQHEIALALDESQPHHGESRIVGRNGLASLQGRAVDLPDVEPWDGPEPVDIAAVLSAVAETIRRYVVLSPEQADTVALYCAHTHAFKASLCSPRLNISSPEKGCGKTTLRDVVAVLVPRSLLTENLSVAVLFRVVEAHAPTILADEYDSWIRDNEELRGLLNAGHRRGGQVLRCEGEGHEVRGFHVFAPAVLCGIGALPGTLHDRSIAIRLERAKPGEIRERFDFRRVERETELCRKLARWCADNFARLENCDPALPPAAFNRLADNWRPLFAVAEVAGGDWPARATAAFAKLTNREDIETQGEGVVLLGDARNILAETGGDRIWSEELCEHLNKLTERPYADMRGGHGINPNRLAKLLGRFKISSRKIRLSGEPKPKQGYFAADFAEAWQRYLAEPPVEGVSKWNTGTSPANTGDSHVSEVEQTETLFHSQNAEKPNNDGVCSFVPLPKRENLETVELADADLI